ncbi:MAG: hypothetical protein ACPG4Z_04995 [Chitinophagales bacterium]
MNRIIYIAFGCIITILVIGFFVIENRNTTAAAAITTCQVQGLEAKSDFESGEYVQIIYGFIIEEEPEFEQFYDKFMYENYQIKRSLGNCDDSINKCYDDKMNELLKAKYGENFYSESRNLAQKAWSTYFD